MKPFGPKPPGMESCFGGIEDGGRGGAIMPRGDIIPIPRGDIIGDGIEPPPIMPMPPKFCCGGIGGRGA